MYTVTLIICLGIVAGNVRFDIVAFGFLIPGLFRLVGLRMTQPDGMLSTTLGVLEVRCGRGNKWISLSA